MCEDWTWTGERKAVTGEGWTLVCLQGTEKTLVRFSVKTRVLETFLEGNVFIEGVSKVFQQQKHILSQSTTPPCAPKCKNLGKDPPG